MIERVGSQHSFYASRQVDNVHMVNKNREEMSKEVRTNFYGPKQNRKQLDEVVDSMNAFMQPSHTSLKFELHEKLNDYYVTVIDEETQEVIREIPSKKMLDMYAAMKEFMGLVIDESI